MASVRTIEGPSEWHVEIFEDAMNDYEDKLDQLEEATGCKRKHELLVEIAEVKGEINGHSDSASAGYFPPGAFDRLGELNERFAQLDKQFAQRCFLSW